MNINNLIRKNIEAMKPYSSARDEFDGFKGVFLDANENPYNNGVNRYPDPYQKALKTELSKIKEISTENILLGNGSDEVLDLLFRAFCEPSQDNVITISPSYGMYKVLANLNDVEIKEVLLEEDFSVNPQNIINKIDDNTKLILLCSPNNPTGNMIEFSVIKNLIENTNCLIVVDEAYIDFNNEKGCVNYLKDYSQLIVIQTFSKYYGMAGIRLGMCFASNEIVTILNKIKLPYNVNVLTQLKALELLNEFDFSYKDEVINEREKLEKELRNIKCIVKVYPSKANFILVKTIDATRIYNELLKSDIIVRNRTKEPLCENCIRITVGTPQENDLLINALKNIK